MKRTPAGAVDSLMQLQPRTLLVALAVQSRACDYVPVHSIMDEMARYGLKHKLDRQLWAVNSFADITMDLQVLRDLGFVVHRGPQWKLNGVPRSVESMVRRIGGAEVELEKPVVDRDLKIKLLRKLAPLLEVSIGDVLDAIRIDDLGDTA